MQPEHSIASAHWTTDEPLVEGVYWVCDNRGVPWDLPFRFKRAREDGEWMCNANTWYFIVSCGWQRWSEPLQPPPARVCELKKHDAGPTRKHRSVVKANRS